MGKDTLLFIGLDTHKEFTEVAYSENDELRSEIRAKIFMLSIDFRNHTNDRISAVALPRPTARVRHFCLLVFAAQDPD